MQLFANIVAVKSNVQFAVLNFILWNLFFYFFYDLVRKINATWLYTDQHRIVQINVTLQNLVSQPFYGNRKLLLSKNRFQTIKILNKNSKALRKELYYLQILNGIINYLLRPVFINW